MSTEEYQMVEAEIESAQEKLKNTGQLGLDEQRAANENQTPNDQLSSDQFPSKSNEEERKSDLKEISVPAVALTPLHVNIFLLIGLNSLLVNICGLTKLETLYSCLIIGISNLIAYLYLFQRTLVVEVFRITQKKLKNVWNYVKPRVTMKRVLKVIGATIAIVLVYILISQIINLKSQVKQLHYYSEQNEYLIHQIRKQESDIYGLSLEVQNLKEQNLSVRQMYREIQQLTQNQKVLEQKVTGLNRDITNTKIRISQGESTYQQQQSQQRETNSAQTIPKTESSTNSFENQVHEYLNILQKGQNPERSENQTTYRFKFQKK